MVLFRERLEILGGDWFHVGVSITRENQTRNKKGKKLQGSRYKLPVRGTEESLRDARLLRVLDSDG